MPSTPKSSEPTCEPLREVLIRHQRRLVDEDEAEAARLEVATQAHVAKLRAQVDVAGVRDLRVVEWWARPTSCSVVPTAVNSADASQLKPGR